MIAERSLTPEPTRSGIDDAPLTDRQVTRWRREGYALVSDLLPPALIAEVAADGAAHFPPAGSPESSRVKGFGSALVFPAESDAFNRVTLHPRLLAAVSQLLGRPIADLRLTQSDLWAKYGRTGLPASRYDNQDQRIHIDYPNHTLVHPAPWDRPEAVEMIVYYSSIDDSGGPTAVVPRLGPDDSLYRWPIVDSPGIGDLPWINDRESAESYLAETRPELAAFRRQLYEREHVVDFRPGTVLLYRHDTWHRGTPLAPGAFRLAQNLTFRRAECEWISTLHQGWAWKMYRPDQRTERLIATASLDQRAVLGFPKPDSSYWCPETIEAVEARFGPLGFDADPYRQACS